ncbi:MAG: hypothetical protein MPJ24_05680 [Pirellulaceae bacterium]|nr:hypothetical protein [Pirellulaceae bacterium]
MLFSLSVLLVLGIYLLLPQGEAYNAEKALAKLEEKSQAKLDDSEKALANLAAAIAKEAEEGSTILDLRGHDLSILPAEIGQLKNLTKLYLGGNRFSYDEKQRIEKMIRAALPRCKIYW